MRLLAVALSVVLCLIGSTAVWYGAFGAISAIVVPKPCISGVTQPAPAAAAGYNCLKIYETWPSLASVDTTDSRATGFTWYTHNRSSQTPPGNVDAGGWNFGNISPTPNTDYSWTTPGQINLAPVSSAPYIDLPVELMTCAQQGTSQNLVGTAFGPGAYIDVELIQFGVWGGNGVWPIAWGVPTDMLIGGVGSPWLVFEPDLFEFFTNPPGAGWAFAYHDWSGTGSTVTYNNSYGTPFFTPNPGDTIGLLTLPSAYNSGTNKVERYQNDTLIAHSTCTSTGSALATCDGNPSTITLTQINNNQHCLAIAGGTAGTTIIGKIQVWTKN